MWVIGWERSERVKNLIGFCDVSISKLSYFHMQRHVFTAFSWQIFKFYVDYEYLLILKFTFCWSMIPFIIWFGVGNYSPFWSCQESPMCCQLFNYWFFIFLLIIETSVMFFINQLLYWWFLTSLELNLLIILSTFLSICF